MFWQMAGGTFEEACCLIPEFKVSGIFERLSLLELMFR